MRACAFILAATLIFSGCATPPAESMPQARAPFWPTLSRFSGEDDFRAYLRAVQAARARAEHRSLSKQNAAANPCPPEQPDCLDDSDIAVTASRASSPPPPPPPPPPPAAAPSAQNPNITNVQNAAVDEGDIVKLVAGRFLVVLQDGRLFSVDTQNGLALVDRMNVYRTTGRTPRYAWYDEMLAYGSRIVVTAYSYAAQATEYSVFSLDETGHITREGVYYISSNDYYDTENYATRLVDGNLVVYTPIFLDNMSGENDLSWPLVRRWLSDTRTGVQLGKGRALFDANQIYRPVRASGRPAIHTFSVCPLGTNRSGDELECRTAALVSDPMREFYVSGEDIFLWTWPSDARRGCSTSSDATLYRIPLNGGSPTAMFVQGHPTDHLGMDSDRQEFRALSVLDSANCQDAEANDGDIVLSYFHAPLSRFSATPRAAGAARYIAMPNIEAGRVENRFTGTHLVFGGRDSWGSYPPDQPVKAGRTVAVPIHAPQRAQVIETPHNVIRVEALGHNAIVTGYRDRRGLSLSVLDLREAPHLASTVTLANRFESEGRSHAFNSMIGADGAGLLGLPTVEIEAESGRWWWRSDSSDVSFLRVDADGVLNSIGPLEVHEDAVDPSYRCEVSCIDWYGNSRPIFIGDRVFALTGSELIEGDVSAAMISERRRINLTTPIAAGGGAR